MVVKELKDSRYVMDNQCQTARNRVPAWFKVAVALHHLAHGGTWNQTAGHARMATMTVMNYTYEVCRGIFFVLRPIFMHPPTPEEVALSQSRFARRRGILDVGLAIDGTHVPWKPDDGQWTEEFHNYK